MGTTCISVYPYQLGQDNDEAIESGAFWFYRKLGFRPGRADLRRLVEREERKITTDPKYRTPARTLKRLASGHVFYEMPGAEVGAWDRFSSRNLGLRVNTNMARRFGGDSQEMRNRAARSLARILSVNPATWSALEKRSLVNFALVLTLVPGVASWKAGEKGALVAIIRAKAAPGEMRYLRLMQQHARLRKALLEAGS